MSDDNDFQVVSYFGLEPRSKGSLTCLEQAKHILCKHWCDIILTLFLYIIRVIIHSSATPHDRIFFERDPTLSYPYQSDEEVPKSLLMVTMVYIPILLCFICPPLYNKVWRSTHKPPGSDHLQYDAFRPCLFFGQACSLNMVLTDFIKMYVGRKRPNFFAICDYHGYRAAIDGDAAAMKHYLSVTSFGAMANISFCRASEELIHEGMKSFPSGHSSSSYVAMWSFTLWFGGAFNFGAKHKAWKLYVMIIPIIIAWAIACTRTRDNWHNFDDILGGVVIGMSSASLVYKLNFEEGIQLPLWSNTDNMNSINSENV